MSGYKRYEVKAGILPAIAPPIGAKALLKALADMGFNDVEVHSTPQNLYGWQGDRRPEKAEVIIRRKYIGNASNDIGFKRRQDGTFEAIVSDFDRTRFSQDWLNKLSQRYGYHVLKSKRVTVRTSVPSEIKTGTAETVTDMTAKALQAQQQRQREEKEAVESREQLIQQKISEIKAQSSSISSQSKIAVKLPASASNSATQALATTQTQVNQLKSRLPQIRSEYQALIEQQLLDEKTVQQALKATEQALNTNNLLSAQAHLQALDDARIQVIQHLRSLWIAQLEYVQQRLDAIAQCIPQSVAQELQASIVQAQTNWQQLVYADIEVLHEEISEFQAQAERIQEAAENLVNSWLEVGYVARILGIDDGDVVVEVETHEGANTQMRIQFYGQQIDLEGPPEESNSCAARTREAIQMFQAQGYQLEWTHLDGEPVPKEWQEYYVAATIDDAQTQEEVAQETSETVGESNYSGKSQRGIEGQRS